MWRRCSCANGKHSLHSQRHRLALFPAVPMGSQGPNSGMSRYRLLAKNSVKSRGRYSTVLDGASTHRAHPISPFD